MCINTLNYLHRRVIQGCCLNYVRNNSLIVFHNIFDFCKQSVQLLSCVWLFETHGLKHTRVPCPSPTPGVYSNSWSLSQWCHPTISPLSFPSPTFNLSQHRGLFQWISSCIRGFNFSICPSNEYSGLISFRIDWFHLLAVQGTLKSLLQHHCSKESVLWCTAFFIIQLLHPHITIEKTIALTRGTFIGKAMALLFNILSRLITTFLLRSRSLLISWVQSLSAMILEPPKIKSVTVSIASLFIHH